MATRLFVGNLPDNVDENDLRKAFMAYGEITHLDLKSKANNDSKDQKKFAFVTLSGSNYDIESCIKYFSSEDFNGSKLYVTRARESFLERLRREREQVQKKVVEKELIHHETSKKFPALKLGDKLNPRKRKLESSKNYEKSHIEYEVNKTLEVAKIFERKEHVEPHLPNEDNYAHKNSNTSEKDNKKYDSEKKRLESMKKKRQEFREKQIIIKTGLTGIDKVPNKKVIFSDNEEDMVQISQSVVKTPTNTQKQQGKNTLFDDDDSDGEVNFEIKKQFEGKKGQQVLDLQSRYKSDKRFVLDERFIEDDPEDQNQGTEKENDEEVELGQTDEKTKQLNILQDLLGVSIRTSSNKDVDGRKSKPKLGMLRFDPSHPEHAKFLVPKDVQQDLTKKVKKKSKDKKEEQKDDIPESVVEKVSKEQFYTVSETLKDAIAQTNTFSLRSLFPTREENDRGSQEQDTDYIPLETPKQSKVKNPLDPGEKNPFVYDSSDSENEDDTKAEIKPDAPTAEFKAVWKENLFFSQNDNRLKEGLAFFNKASATEVQKERRGLKSLVKKRIYNKERKNQMFQKKIGGRKKTIKKSFRKKS